MMSIFFLYFIKLPAGNGFYYLVSYNLTSTFISSCGLKLNMVANCRHLPTSSLFAWKWLQSISNRCNSCIADSSFPPLNINSSIISTITSTLSMSSSERSKRLDRFRTVTKYNSCAFNVCFQLAGMTCFLRFCLINETFVEISDFHVATSKHKVFSKSGTAENTDWGSSSSHWLAL